MRFRPLGVALLTVGLLATAGRASATLITLPVIGGPGLTQGAICTTSVLCPSSPTLTLAADAAVTGSFVYDDVANTVSFSLSLAAPATFTGGAPPATLLAGSLYTVSAIPGIPVMKIPLGGGAYEIVQVGAAAGVALPIAWGPPYGQTVGVPDISGLTCTVNTGSDQCGFSLGPGGNLITDGATPYQVFETFNVNVPEPATLAIVGAGLAALLLVSRRAA